MKVWQMVGIKGEINAKKADVFIGLTVFADRIDEVLLSNIWNWLQQDRALKLNKLQLIWNNWNQINSNQNWSLNDFFPSKICKSFRR